MTNETDKHPAGEEQSLKSNQDSARTPKNAPPFSGSTAFPSAPGTQWYPFNPALAQLSHNFSSFYAEKIDPKIMEMQLDTTRDLAEKIHTESMRSYDIQEKNSDYLYKMADRRERKDDGILIYLGVIVLLILVVGIAFLFNGKTAEGVGIVSGIMGLLLGFLGGYGVARRSVQ